MQFAIFALLPAAVLGQAVFNTATPVGFSGSGCPTNVPVPQRPRANFTDNNQRVVITYPLFNARLDRPGENNKNCDVALNINWASGCTRITVDGTLQGEVRNLTPGVAATVIRRYDLQGVNTNDINPPQYRQDLGTVVTQDYTIPDRLVAIRRGGQTTDPFTFRGRLDLNPRGIFNARGVLSMNKTTIVLTPGPC